MYKKLKSPERPARNDQNYAAPGVFYPTRSGSTMLPKFYHNEGARGIPEPFSAGAAQSAEILSAALERGEREATLVTADLSHSM